MFVCVCIYIYVYVYIYIYIYIYICNLATYRGSLVTQFLANLDVFVYSNTRSRSAYVHICLKIAHDPKHVAMDEYVYANCDA